ncbi:MAG TPA: hypothetical protein VH325_11085 [Bryobacteraceae bacterium]|jgi:hypothetical protein|nr:hypothetical protein [Bryobacteraceae bacterium]
MNLALIFALVILGPLSSRAQTEPLILHIPGAPNLVFRDVRIGATYQEINAYTARVDASLSPAENVAWVHLTLQLEMVLENGTRRRLAMQCSDCAGPLSTYFESSPWEAEHVKTFVFRAVSGDYLTEKELLAYSGWVARDSGCYAQAVAKRNSLSALAASGCIETTQTELAATVGINEAGASNGAVMVALTNSPGEPSETHLGLVPKRLLRMKRMRVMTHVESQAH